MAWVHPALTQQLEMCISRQVLVYPHRLRPKWGEALGKVPHGRVCPFKTFPNGRTGGPCIDENLVIIHAITASWGKHGPARDRFLCF